MSKYGANNIDGLTIGNEVNDSPTNIMQRVWDVRGYLNNVIGYKGPISTVHTWVQVMNNPVLCDADRVTVNAHAFFDGNVQAGNAGNFIRDTVLPPEPFALLLIRCRIGLPAPPTTVTFGLAR